eukprot:5567144-Alexandrium_andersonii.AAC.1
MLDDAKTQVSSIINGMCDEAGHLSNAVVTTLLQALQQRSVDGVFKEDFHVPNNHATVAAKAVAKMEEVLATIKPLLEKNFQGAVDELQLKLFDVDTSLPCLWKVPALVVLVEKQKGCEALEPPSFDADSIDKLSGKIDEFVNDHYKLQQELHKYRTTYGEDTFVDVFEARERRQFAAQFAAMPSACQMFVAVCERLWRPGCS